VVLSPREINDHRRTVVVLPLTTTETPAMFPLLVHTPSIGANSKVRTEHIRAIDKSRLSGYITDIGANDLQEINRALCQVLAIKALSA
jgi:mRNA-degrading endonuclease toxin of MazEF toxin-antitoxin module